MNLSPLWRALGLLALLTHGEAVCAQAAEWPPRRLALVLANAAYPGAPLPSAVNDAALIAGALRSAGFDVLAARDLDLPATRQSAQEFINRLSAAGPGGAAFVFLSGYGAQVLGENYLLPAGAAIAQADDVPAQGLSLPQLLRALSAAPASARVVVLDTASAAGLAPLPAGLAMPDTPPGLLLALNTAPGTLAAPEAGPYSSYALALAAALREPGLGIDEIFVRARMHTAALTGGAQTPWHSSTLRTPLVLQAGASGGAAAASAVPDPAGVVRSRPVTALPEAEAYMAAIDRDTLKGYSEFLEAFPHSAHARRMAALLGARRETLAWKHAVADDQPQAYWTYLARYAVAGHAGEARARLAGLGAALVQPPGFEPLDDGLAPPSEAERPYIERGAALDQPGHFAPPPPAPLWAGLPALSAPPVPPVAAGAFALAAPGFAPADSGGAASRAGGHDLPLPAAVAIAIAGKRLVPPPPPARQRPVEIIGPIANDPAAESKPSAVLILPVTPPSAAREPHGLGAMPPVEPPASAAEPSAAEKPHGQVLIAPREPPSPSAEPPPAPPDSAPAPVGLRLTPIAPAPAAQAAPPESAPAAIPLPEPAAAPAPPAPAPVYAPAKSADKPADKASAAPKPAQKPRGPRVEPARVAAPAVKRQKWVDPNAPLDLRPPRR